jgi:hypothetical protein
MLATKEAPQLAEAEDGCDQQDREEGEHRNRGHDYDHVAHREAG